MNYLYHLFRSENGILWSYDTVSNRLVRLAGLPMESPGVEAYLIGHGFIQPCPPPSGQVVFRASEEQYARMLDGMCGRLTLELTQVCNLRCSYCVYSGKFPGWRAHSTLHMGEEISVKAIGMFEKCSRQRSMVSLDFYGGEALLRFEQLRALTALAREKLSPRGVVVHIGTNGTLLNDEICRWINDTRDVYLDITLNGESHDRYRRYADGGPTKRDILNRVAYLFRHYPAAAERVNFICNAYSGREMEALCDFYDAMEVAPALITDIEPPPGGREFPPAGEEDIRAEARMRRKYLETESPFLRALYEPGLLRIHHRPAARLDGVVRLEGTCLPLLSNLFVSAEGDLRVCEKMADPSLGDVWSGIDFEAAAAMMRAYASVLGERCGNCWARRLCSVCYRSVHAGEGGPGQAVCRSMRESVAADLALYAGVCESAPDRLARFDLAEPSTIL